jgi:signal peptidase I
MEPALESGQLLLINKAAYWRLVGRPQRGDVVVFRMPAPPAADLVKRVVGLPGDQVLIRDGTLVVNGQEIDEPYVTTPAAYSYPEDGRPVQVPDDAYFVLGDNRPDSVDSHLGWYVPADNIIGRAWLSYWPLARWGVLRASPARTAEPGLNPPRSPDMLHVSPTGEPEPTPVAKSLATLVDDQFTAPLPGWPNNPSSTAWFGDGGYHLLAREAGRFVAVGVPMPAPRRNVIVSARFRKVGGPSGGGYGLIVRDTGPGPRDGLDQGGHYYVFEAGDRGEVGLWRRDQNRWIDLVPWSKSGVVRTGTAPNELEARASGDQLTLTVNGTVVATQTDAQLGSGGIGVFLGGDGNEAVLDRLVVQAADEDTSATGTSIDS